MHRAQGVLTMGQLRILSEKDVRSVLDTSTALDLARRTLIDQTISYTRTTGLRQSDEQVLRADVLVTALTGKILRSGENPVHCL